MSSQVTLRGASGNTYTFYAGSMSMGYQAVGGVYAFAKTEYSNYKILYVGRASDLSTRFNGHHKIEQAKRMGANTILSVGYDSEFKRKEVELDLYYGYKPPLNDVKPG